MFNNLICRICHWRCDVHGNNFLMNFATLSLSFYDRFVLVWRCVSPGELCHTAAHKFIRIRLQIIARRGKEILAYLYISVASIWWVITYSVCECCCVTSPYVITSVMLILLAANSFLYFDVLFWSSFTAELYLSLVTQCFSFWGPIPHSQTSLGFPLTYFSFWGPIPLLADVTGVPPDIFQLMRTNTPLADVTGAPPNIFQLLRTNTPLADVTGAPPNIFQRLRTNTPTRRRHWGSPWHISTSEDQYPTRRRHWGSP